MSSKELRQKTDRTKTRVIVSCRAKNVKKKKRKVSCGSRATAASYKKRESSFGLQNVFFIIILPLLLPSFLLEFKPLSKILSLPL